MAKLNLGVLGGFSGTVGTVVGVIKQNGDDVIRAKTKIRRVSNTEAQVNQRLKFGLVTRFIKPLNSIISIGFRGVAGKQMNPNNYACKVALKQAITGTTASDFALDYSKVLMSDGGLNRPSAASAELASGVVNFHWGDNSQTSTGDSTDKVVLLVYNVDNKEISYSVGATTRADGEGSLPLPYHEVGDQLLTFMFFQSASDPLQVSQSQFLGSVTA